MTTTIAILVRAGSNLQCPYGQVRLRGRSRIVWETCSGAITIWPVAGSHNHGVRISAILGSSPTLSALIGRQKVDFRTVSLSVPSGTGRRSIQGTENFGSRVFDAGVALNGFKLDYVNSDHHINVSEVDTDIVSLSGNSITFRVECNYADRSFDDPYFGYVTATVLAEVE